MTDAMYSRQKSNVEKSERIFHQFQLACLRCILIVLVSGRMAIPSENIKEAANTIAEFRDNFRSKSEARNAAVLAAQAAIRTVETSSHLEAAKAGFVAIQISDRAYVDDTIRAMTDCAANLDNLEPWRVVGNPLWSRVEPDYIEGGWYEVKRGWTVDLNDWWYWIDWYEGLRRGSAPDWELWHQIALIPNDIWNDGPEAVARAIEDIKARLLILRQPLAEDLIPDPDTGQFEAVPRPIANPQLLSTTLAQVDDAIDDVLAQTANGLRADSIDIRILKRAIDRYANDPQRVERDMNAVSNSLLHQIAVDDLPASADNMLLQKLTHQVAVGLRGAHPEIAANHQLLQDQALAEISAEKRQLIADAAPVLEAVVTGQTKDQMRDDLLVLAQDMRIGAPPLPGVTRFDADSLQRVGNRAAKIQIALRSDEKLLDRLEKSTSLRGATIGLTIVETVKLIFSLLG